MVMRLCRTKFDLLDTTFSNPVWHQKVWCFQLKIPEPPKELKDEPS
jgi:hypothetical protein